MTDRIDKHKSWALKTKEFQMKQMEERRQNEMNQMQKTRKDAQKEIKRVLSMEQNEQEEIRFKKQQLRNLKNDLFSQMEERRARIINEDKMHNIDRVLNSEIIRSLSTNPQLPAKSQRKLW